MVKERKNSLQEANYPYFAEVKYLWMRKKELNCGASHLENIMPRPSIPRYCGLSALVRASERASYAIILSSNSPLSSPSISFTH